MRLTFLVCFSICFQLVNGQPFIDLVNLRFLKSPDAGFFNRDKQPNDFNYLNISVNLPIVFKKDSSILMFSPFVEKWQLHLDNVYYVPVHLQSLALPVAYLKPVSSKWNLAVNFIPRWNGYNNRWIDNNFQAGGALLAAYRKNRRFEFKFGVYYNSEFSGPFFMPLLGLNWKMSEKNNLFGVLPGNLTWEHKVSTRFYYGAVFRAVTNTYQDQSIPGARYYVRIDDNHLSFYADCYLSKKIVLNFEAGHSVLRKIRLGFDQGRENYFFYDKTNDDFIFRAALVYRKRM